MTAKTKTKTEIFNDEICGEIPRPEYPRPSLRRKDSSWMNLNGRWEFEIDASDSGWERFVWKKEKLDGEIIVPFAPESRLSGVENQDFMKRVWYRRKFSLNEKQLSDRVLLHFGAVDYISYVWVNGTIVGNHTGGYTPFSFDITENCREGINSVVVTAFDDTRSKDQPSGKQSSDYDNFGCFYTRTTGIWQTVWLEFVPRTYITNVWLAPNVARENVNVRVRILGDNVEEGKETRFFAAVKKDGRTVSEEKFLFRGDETVFSLPVKNPELWDVGNPELYDIEIRAEDDKVLCYFGMREIKISGKKFLLNGRPVFQKLVLDQGYYPSGVYTAESDEEISRDIELSMAAGFNGARMHMKIFEPRYIYHADKKGYLLWGEYPNWGLECDRKGAAEYMLPEWIEEIERDFNSPAIIGWCPFNEAGGDNSKDLFRLVYETTKLIDPTRPVIDTSGWFHSKTDIFDVHDYEQDPDKFASHYVGLSQLKDFYVDFPEQNLKYDGKIPYFVSECGGTFYDVENPSEGWGYGDKPENEEMFFHRFETIVTTLIDNPDVCGFCYTQLYDVMQEKNGLYTYDRRPKFDVERIRKIVGKTPAVENGFEQD